MLDTIDLTVAEDTRNRACCCHADAHAKYAADPDGHNIEAVCHAPE